jgi:hypothetical protein
MQYKIVKAGTYVDPEIRVGDIGEYVEGGRGPGQMVRLRINDIVAWFFGDEVVKL